MESTLSLVTSPTQIVSNIRRFHIETATRPSKYRSLIETATYFVYDPISGWFAPAKYAGIKDMNLELYAECLELQKINSKPSVFDGNRTQTAIAKLCFKPTFPPNILHDFDVWLDSTGIRTSRKYVIYSAGTVVDKPILEKFTNEIKTLKVDTSNGVRKRYKPLLLFAAFRLVREGKLISYGDPLLSYYKESASLINENYSSPHYPYFHLGSSDF